MVMVCFYNHTSYILQAHSSEERDAWVECARQLNIERPKPSEACLEQDEIYEIRRSGSTASFSTTGKPKSTKVSLLKRLKILPRSSMTLYDDMGPIPEIDPDQLSRTEEEENARRMQLGQPSQWEVRRLPLDLGVIPPLEHPIPFRRSHLYDTSVTIVDLTTGKTAPGEFGMGIEDRAAYFQDECALFAVLRPARLIPHNEMDRQRDDFFLCCKRLHSGEVMYVEPPYITDFYARSWLHPDLQIEFDPESRSVMIANMYRVVCSTSAIVTEFQKYHGWLMKNAKILPDNTFLNMDYGSQLLRIAKRNERPTVPAESSTGLAIPSVATGSKVFETSRQYTDLGECNIEFRRMSNAPDALSVGFYNLATKRDMATGVMMFDKIKVKATASTLGLSTLNALGPSNGVMIQMAFQDGVLDALEEEQEDIQVETMSVRTKSSIDEEKGFEGDVESLSTSPTSPEQHIPAVEPVDDMSGHRADGYLETVLEEDEEELDEGSKDAASDRREDAGSDDRDDSHSQVMAGSTGTFRFKSKSALFRMEKERQQNDVAAAEEASTAPGLRLPPISPSSFKNLTSDGVLSEYLDTKSYPSEDQGVVDTAAISVAGLKQFWANASGPVVRASPQPQPRATTSVTSIPSISSTPSTPSDSSNPVSPSVSPGSNPTSTTATLSSPSSPSLPSSTTDLESSESPVTPDAEIDPPSSDQDSEEEVVLAEPTTELEARVMAVKSAVSRSFIFAQASEGAQVETNADGVVLATRYPPKRPLYTDAAASLHDKDHDIQPGVEVEHHMPVRDLRKRWEEIHRLGL
ncbi:MAG: hypothetical protein J3Q66DRAFT_372467 [Benniella sp.]|nr:MAG: hypothetical protein J3Q66DRAFT_372467 [Benniella sp.]